MADGGQRPRGRDGRFIDGAFDVLVATTIIGGIDISNANTILINEAHKLGS